MLWANAGRTTDHDAMIGDEVVTDWLTCSRTGSRTDCPQSSRRASFQPGVIICREGASGLEVEGGPDSPARQQIGFTI